MPFRSQANPSRGAMFFLDGLTKGGPTVVVLLVTMFSRNASWPFLSAGMVKNS